MDPLDAELNTIINKLNKVQGAVGGGKAKVSAIGEDGKLDRFLDLKGRMLERLHDLKETLQQKETLDKAGGNPKDLIAAGSKIRTDLAALNEEWKELDQIYRAEAKKKRSKHTPEEMAMRQQILMKLQMEITNIKEAQRAGYVKGYQAVQISSMEDSELFKPVPGGNAAKNRDWASEDGEERRNASSVVTGSRNNNMTDEHRLQLHALKERDTLIVSLEITELFFSFLPLKDKMKYPCLFYILQPTLSHFCHTYPFIDSPSIS